MTWVLSFRKPLLGPTLNCPLGQNRLATNNRCGFFARPDTVNNFHVDLSLVELPVAPDTTDIVAGQHGPAFPQHMRCLIGSQHGLHLAEKLAVDRGVVHRVFEAADKMLYAAER